METTEHYGLKQPGVEEFYDVQDQNGNMEAIDGALHGLEVGKAALDPATGKVKAELLPEMDYEAPLKDAPAKEAPADADALALVNAADGKTHKLLWSRVKAVLKGWFDTLYAAVGHTHTAAQVGARPDTWMPDAVQVGGIPISEKGAPGGVAGLDEQGKLPADVVPGGTADAAVEAHDASVDAHANMNWIRAGAGEPAAPLPVNADLLEHKTLEEVQAPGLAAAAAVESHGADRNNPHGVTRGQIGALGQFGPVDVSVPLSWAGSGPWEQVVSVAGVTADMELLGLHPAKSTDDAARKLQEKAYGCITWAETVDGGIKLTCRDKKPEVAFQAVVKGEQ